MVTEKELVQKQINPQLSIIENCPRFSFCSVNKCPLDHESHKFQIQSEDKEKKCLLGKTRRKRLLKWYSIEKQKYAEITKENNSNVSNNSIKKGGNGNNGQ